jgi:hypothetical protein
METITADTIYQNINFVVQNVDKIYKETHTRGEYVTYKLAQKTSRFFKFMRSPQIKVLSLLVFWAFFVTSWLLASFAIGTLAAFIVFGVMIALYTNATMEAVSSIIRNTMFNYYSGLLGNVKY